MDTNTTVFYTDSPFAYRRRITREVNIGGVYMGGNNPIRIQSMTNTSTLDTKACVDQIMRLASVGTDYVRLTAASMADAKNLSEIKKSLSNNHCFIPLIADIHFNAKVAEEAAKRVEKIRINPGNYIDKKTDKLDYSDSEYKLVLERIALSLHPLLKICKENGTAMRIGTNHGSLSQRIMSRYGNTSMGMAVSAMEFVAICHDFGFHDIVLSMKASNTKVMIHAVRLLVAMMDEKQWNYPLHLGVTEAGDGEYGRIKSAAGILPLLADGIGDTIRVSLTEAPENEIPFASLLAKTEYKPLTHSDSYPKINYNPYAYTKRKIVTIGETHANTPFIVSDANALNPSDIPFEIAETFENIKDGILPQIIEKEVLVFELNQHIPLLSWRSLVCELIDKKLKNPIIWKVKSNEKDWMRFYAKTSGDIALMACDGFVDGIWIENENFTQTQLYQLSLHILQACGLRYSQAEYIACPSCGRTQYDIQEVLGKIKEKTRHLRNLKIAVMGCIVNGPGEMADADYGFVGSGKGLICLYKGKNLVMPNIKESLAIDRLIQLIKDNGDWVDE